MRLSALQPAGIGVGPRQVQSRAEGAGLRLAASVGIVALACAGASLRAAAAPGWETTFGGYVAAEARTFPSGPQDPRQEDFEGSLVFAPEFKATEGKLTFTLSPFARLDSADSTRTHADLRECNLLYEFDKAEVLVGMAKVFWGATEAVHWVDVINQTDLVEDPDGKSKLGQPMVSASAFTDFGKFSFYYLPFFRERTYPGADGRLRTIPRVLGYEPIYESDQGNHHPDFALRWSQSIDDLDIGISYFRGTTREPTYVPVVIGANPGPGIEVVLRPYYEIVDQAGLDLTWTRGDWLLKSEVMYRHGQGNEDLVRVAGGFEYTFYGVFGSPVDAGLIGEFLHDSAGENPINPFEGDIVAGTRLTFNDLADTTLLATVIVDASDATTYLNIEAKRHFGSHLVARLLVRAFMGVPPEDFPLNGYRLDQYAQLGLEWHF